MATLQRSRYLLRFYDSWTKLCQHQVRTVQQVYQHNNAVCLGVEGLLKHQRRFLTVTASTSSPPEKIKNKNSEANPISPQNVMKSISSSKSVHWIATHLQFYLGDEENFSYQTSEERMDIIQACISRLSNLTDAFYDENVNHVINDPKMLEELQNFVQSRIQNEGMPLVSVVVFLKFFLQHTTEDKELIGILLSEGERQLKEASIEQVFKLLQTVEHLQTTDKRKEFFEACKEKIKEHICDISSPKLLISTMYLLHSAAPETRKQLNTLALKMVDTMTPVQVYRLLYLLASACAKDNAFIDNNLVKAAVIQLYSKPLIFDEKKLKNLFYACTVLNIRDSSLLKEISLNFLDIFLTKRSATILSTVTESVLFSCSKLAWNYSALTCYLIEDLKAAYANNLLTDWQCASVVTSIANMNLIQYGDFAVEIAQDIDGLKVSNPRLWLNVVHSLASLGKVDENQLKHVLRRDFYIPLLKNAKDKPQYIQDMIKTRLLNIHGCLHIDVGLKEPVLNPDSETWVKSLQEAARKTPDRTVFTEVAAAINCIAPQIRNSVDKFGHKLDFEIFLDENGKAKHIGDVTEIKKRVGIKILELKDMILGDQKPVPCGSSVLAIRHLRADRDAVITVQYDKFAEKTSRKAQIQYLEALIKEAVELPTDSSSGSSSESE